MKNNGKSTPLIERVGQKEMWGSSQYKKNIYIISLMNSLTLIYMYHNLSTKMSAINFEIFKSQYMALNYDEVRNTVRQYPKMHIINIVIDQREINSEKKRK